MGREDDDDDDESDDDDRRRRKKKSSRKNKDDDDDDDRRRRCKKVKKKKREREDSSNSSNHSRSGDDDDDDSSSDDSYHRRRRRHKKHKKRRKRQYSDDDSDDDDDDDDSRHDHDRKIRHDRKKESKKKKKDQKKKKKNSKKDKKKDNQQSSSSSLQLTTSMKDDNHSLLLHRNHHVFATALYDLLEDHPALSADLPIMLIRMAGGASLDLSQMSDVGAARGIENVFKSLQLYGVQQQQQSIAGSSWTWKAPGDGGGGGGGANHELILVKIARTLLDQIGVTMEAVNNYGREEPQDEVVSPPNDKEVLKGISEYTPLQKQTFSLLDRFLQKDRTLSNQLGELCNMILSGESVALDGLSDQSLREALEQLFRGAGLGRSEMDHDNDDDDDEDEDGDVTMGYGIPETNGQFARANMEHILDACRYRAATSQEVPKRVMRGPLPQHMADQYALREEHANDDDDDDDDDGPAPVGMTKARASDGPSKEDIAVMAEVRRQELEGLVSGNGATTTKPGEREEWMIHPGEHDLLQNIKSGAMKNRNFVNKKVRESAVTNMVEGPVDPTMQAEVDAIVQAHRDARGPSLMDQHREAKAAAAAAAAQSKKVGKSSFNWSRDGDLDAGRRVDKDHLRLLMGGAGGELMDKFQGGFSKS